MQLGTGFWRSFVKFLFSFIFVLEIELIIGSFIKYFWSIVEPQYLQVHPGHFYRPPAWALLYHPMKAQLFLRFGSHNLKQVWLHNEGLDVIEIGGHSRKKFCWNSKKSFQFVKVEFWQTSQSNRALSIKRILKKLFFTTTLKYFP